MHLSGLSPFGPIFGKELRTAARRKRNYLLRVVYLGGLLLFLLLAYVNTVDVYYGASGVAARAQQQQQLGRMFFLFYSLFCVGAMGLIGPVVTATAINGERQAKTLNVLLMTPLTAWQIVAGKLFSRLLTAITLIGLSLPVLALVRLLGGVELYEMFGVICLCAVTAIIGAAVGLLLSTINNRAYAVILLSYFAMAVLYVFVPMLVAMYLAGTSMRGALPWIQMLSRVNPFWAAGWLGSGQRSILVVDWEWCVAIHLIASAVLLMLSAAVLRRQVRREGQRAGRIEQAPLLADATEGIADEQTRRSKVTQRSRSRSVSDLPVLWRELRRPLMTGKWQRIVGSFICVGLLLFAYFSADQNKALHDRELQLGFAFIFHTLLLVLVGVLASTSISQEKEGDTWTVLLASPISGGAIVWGKTVGVLRRIFWPCVLIAGHFTLFTIFGIIPPLGLLMILAVIFGFNTIWLATGIALSLRMRKLSVAVITNLLLPVAVYGVVPLVLAVIDGLMHGHDVLTMQMLWYLPYYYLGEGISNMREGRWNECTMPGGGRWHVRPEAFVMTMLFVAAIHVGLSVLILMWTARRLNHVVGRAPQTFPLGPSDLSRAETPSWASAENTSPA